MENKMKPKNFKPKLQKHCGCEGCTKKCRFNADVALKDKADESKSMMFDCNSRKVKRSGE